jgi:hypothetical protein
VACCDDLARLGSPPLDLLAHEEEGGEDAGRGENLQDRRRALRMRTIVEAQRHSFDICDAVANPERSAQRRHRRPDAWKPVGRDCPDPAGRDQANPTVKPH